MATAEQVEVDRTERRGLALPFVLLCILTPVAITVAGIRLTPIRVVMLLTIVPLTVNLLRGRYGPVTGADWAILVLAPWMFVPMFYNHGAAQIPFAGISAVELLGAYLLGRAIVRGPNGYVRLIKLHLWSMIVLSPFVLVELQTGRLVIPSLIPPPFETLTRADSAYGRMGLERVYAVMEHPILWGLYCSIVLANLAYLFRSVFAKLAGIGFSIFMTFTSLSSAPLISVGVQVGMLVWGWLTEGRWRLAAVLFAIFYVVIDLLSNRNPITLMIGYLTFNQGSAWTRILIFEFGSAAVMNSPIFGVGFNSYPKPSWLTGSVDNFWLVQAIRYGLPGLALLAGVFLLHLWGMIRAPLTDERDLRLRTGHGITIVGLCFVLGTVHIWGNAQAFVFFYLGAGAWMYTGGATPPRDEGEAVPEEEPERGTRFTRFARGAPGPRRPAAPERARPVTAPAPASVPRFARARP